MIVGTAQTLVQWLFEQPHDRLYEIRERRKGRSLTQNAYYWSLLNQLAREVGLSDTEVHGRMLRDYGTAEVFSVRDDVPVDGYFRYYDVIGHGWANGRLFKHIRVYKGSSEMDSKEFSRLIDGMRQECEQVGIPVMTPEEVASLRFVEGARDGL